MAKEKRMDESAFETILKEKTAFAEEIRANQNEKQSIMDEFERERERYRRGEISRQALAASLPRIKKEIARLDKSIRKNILGVRTVARKATRFAEKQKPQKFKVTMEGMRGFARRTTKRKTVRRLSTRRKTSATRRKSTARTTRRR